MFFVTFLRRELWRRRKQAVVIALGLAVGIGLVITVTAAAAGVRAAQGRVLKSLYGVGTDITVTTKPAVASPGGPDPGHDQPRRLPGLPGQPLPSGRHQARQPDQRVVRPDLRLQGRVDPRPARGHRGRRGPGPQRHPDRHPRLGGHRRLAAPAARRQRGRHGSHPSRARPAEHRPDQQRPEPGPGRRARECRRG